VEAIAARLAEFYRVVLAGRAQRPSSIFRNTPSSTK
jgi:hypothetical protein